MPLSEITVTVSYPSFIVLPVLVFVLGLAIGIGVAR